MMKKILLFVLLFAVIFAGYFAYSAMEKNSEDSITTFEECAEKYPVMESYPEQCSTPDGRHFTRDIGNQMQFSDELIINSPRPNTQITSPLQLDGSARGFWFFEATLNAEVYDAEGQSLGMGFATAEGEWMTEEFVEFSGSMEFDTPSTDTGTVVIRNANPSGLPENQKELTIPVRF